MKTLDEILNDIDAAKKLTLENAVAIYSLGYGIIVRLHDFLLFDEKNAISQKMRFGIE